MLISLIACLLLALIIQQRLDLTRAAANFPNGFKQITYLTSWTGSPSSIPYSKLTHVNYAFMSYSSNGSTSIPNTAKLQQLVTLAHQNNVKVLISIGGWTGDDVDDTFEALAANATSRNTFITNVMNAVAQYSLDGVDIDWEYPRPESAGNYTALIQGLHSNLASRFGAGSKLLTAAVVSDDQGAWYSQGISSNTYQYFDFLNIMAYDGPAVPHANYDWSIASFNFWVNTKGLPRNKAVLGVPFYSKPNVRLYRDIVAANPANSQVDCVGSDCYNGIPTMKRKTRYVIDNGGSGMMHWEISQDTNDQYSLVNAIYEEAMLGGGSATATRTRTNTSGTGPTATRTRTNTSGTTPPTATTGGGAGCWTPWSSSTVYTNGMQASDNGRNYQANWWNQGDRPSTSTSGAWADKGACGTTPPTATRTRTNTTGTTPPTATRTRTRTPTGPTATRTRTNTTGTTPPTATRTRTNTTGTTPPTATRTRTNTSGTTTPAWAPNTAYAVGATVSYNGVNYRCAQAHTSQVGWEPPNVPALWTRL